MIEIRLAYMIMSLYDLNSFFW